MTLDEMPAPALGYADIVLPDYCGTVSGCGRAGRLDQLVGSRDEVERERQRAKRTRSPRAARNLAEWITGAEHRFAVLYDMVKYELADDKCTHTPEARQRIPIANREAVLPPCTC